MFPNTVLLLGTPTARRPDPTQPETSELTRDISLRQGSPKSLIRHLLFLHLWYMTNGAQDNTRLRRGIRDIAGP